MSSLDNYRIERNVYLVLWSVGFLVAALELGADWARWSAKRSLNPYHVRQHIMQVLCALLGIVENTDSHVALGVFSGLWQSNILAATSGSLILCTMQLSCYLLLKSHFAIIEEHPRWLKPVFLSTGIVLSLLHIGLGTFIGASFAGDRIRQADSVVVTVWCLLQMVLIDAGFCRVRSVVLLSDKSSATENKLYPQYLKVGRVVLLLNIAILSVTTFVVYSFVLASYSTQSASSISFKGLVRVVALYATLWWTFHPICSRAKPTSSVVSGSGRPSSQIGGSPKVPSRRISANPASSALASLAARESDCPSSSSSASSSSPSPSSTSDLPICESAASLPASAAPSEHIVVEIAAQS